MINDDPVYGREEWQPHSCPCCEKCWMVVKSSKRGRVGRCVYGGPYLGFVEIPEPKK